MTVKNAALSPVSALLVAAVICWMSMGMVMAANDVVPKTSDRSPTSTDTARSIVPDAMRQICREVNNGCQVCVILPPSGIIHCSLPGIACQPRAWTCRVPIGKQDDGVTSEK